MATDESTGENPTWQSTQQCHQTSWGWQYLWAWQRSLHNTPPWQQHA